MRAALKKASQAGGIQVGLLLAIFASVIMVTAVTYDSEVRNQPWQQTVTPGQLKKLLDDLPGMDRAEVVDVLKGLVGEDTYQFDSIERDLAAMSDADFEALKASIAERLDGKAFGQTVAELSQMLNGYEKPKKTAQPTPQVTPTARAIATESPYLFDMVTPTPIPTQQPPKDWCKYGPTGCGTPITVCVCDANSTATVGVSQTQCSYPSCDNMEEAPEFIGSGCVTDLTWSWTNTGTSEPAGTGEQVTLGPGTYSVTAEYNIGGQPEPPDGSKNCYKSNDVIVAYIEIQGFSKAPIWSLGNACDPQKHSSQCNASTTPSGLPIEYLIVGDNHGATIDSTGLVTPGSGSGEITVRASIQGFSGCYADAQLLILAHPTGIVSTTGQHVHPEGKYGGKVTHTFASSGGSLEGVEITEKVETKDPNPFMWMKLTEPGVVTWTLDASGKMMAADVLWTDIQDPKGNFPVDARMFLPPPLPGLPQTGTDTQKFYWWCPMDAKAPFICGPSDMDVTLSVGALTVTSDAYGQAFDDDYLGPAAIWNVAAIPLEICADGVSTSQGYAVVAPVGRSLVWDIRGDTLGASVNGGTGLFTAGSSGGGLAICVMDARWISDNTIGSQLTLVKVDSVSVRPAILTADGASHAFATATTSPPGRSILWSIQGDNRGCTIDAGSGVVTAGTSPGMICVRATDSQISGAWAEIWLTLAFDP